MSYSNEPPRWALKFLRWFCKPELLEDIEGDLYELFYRRGKNLFLAQTLFILDILRFFRPTNIKTPSHINMLLLLSHFKIARRNILKNKSYSFIHMTGLTIGLFTTALLCLYVQHEYAFDRHHSKANEIYRLTHTRFVSKKESYQKASVFPELGHEIQTIMPQVKSSARLFPVASEYEPIFTFEKPNGDESQFSESNLYLADSTFTKIFDFNWIEGGGDYALNEPNSLIVSKSTALNVFKTTDIIGKSITWQGMGTWVIKGVFDDWPTQSHVNFKILASWFKVYGEASLYRWDGFYTYLLTTPGIDQNRLYSDINSFADKYLAPYNDSKDIDSEIGLQPLTDIHLKSHLNNELSTNGDYRVVNSLLIIAIAILIIAIVNYVNLASSSALERSHEVGVRKVVGSSNQQIRIQYLIESFCIVLIAHLFAVILVQISLPGFNQWINSNIHFSPFTTDLTFYGILLISIIVITALSGSYPALIMARFKAIGLLEKNRKHSHFGFRSTLMTAQFCIALLLSVVATVVYFQTDHLTSKNLGFNQNILVLKSMELVSEHGDSVFVNKFETLKNEFANYQDLGQATLTSHIPGVVNNWIGQVGIGDGRMLVNTARVRIDRDFLNVYNLKLLAGRFYNFNDEKHPYQQVVVNRKLTEMLGFDTPDASIGAKLSVSNSECEIIGVIEDFHMQSPKQEILPSMYTLGGGHKSFLSIALKSESIDRAVELTRESWLKLFPEKPFQYFFIENQMYEQFTSDRKLTQIVGYFATFAVFLACLGLFGMSNFMINQKHKELSIRRVFGATYWQLYTLLSKGHVLLIFCGAIIAIPGSYFISTRWLAQYATKISLNPFLFVVPLLVVSAIALLTIFFNTLKVKNSSPTEQLK